ncbi:hypothetical protein HJ588_04065 [Flexivirga sp. ID2601S]|uniref:XRE family transcriptional regulator n=1 Tax=Flexivirga aerilata TaxID=1656889 RepID=A0A849AJ71_9MICO|nr:hypothetical protein [Flexivirga aerilata]NNG38450.1 hypothetical protein [Flexivirga aerilata]
MTATGHSPLVPDFHFRLNLAADAIGLTAPDIWRGLQALGLPVSRNYIYTLMRGEVADPRHELIAGLARVLQVDVRWFFVLTDSPARDALLLGQYRIRPEDGAPAAEQVDDLREP